MAACQSAVSGIIAHRRLLGLNVPTEDTGDYCRTRAKLNEDALHELSCTVAGNSEAEVDSRWLVTRSWLMVLLSPCPIRQAATSQNAKPGFGFPIGRCVTVISLVAACVLDLTIGAYVGKENGETALLRQLIHGFTRGTSLFLTGIIALSW